MADHIRRRLLFLLPFPPRLDATHGGSRVIAQLLVKLADRHDVAVLYLRAPDEPQIDEVIVQRCDLVEAILRPTPSRSFAQQCLYRLRVWYESLRGRPEWVTDWAVPAYATRLRSLIQTWQPDLVQLEYHLMGRYLPALTTYAGPKVLVEHDPGARAAEERWRTLQRFSKLKQFVDALAWKRFERAIVNQVEAVVVFTERDRQAVRALATTTPIVKIAFGTTLPEHPLSSLGQPPPSLLFVGNFVHPPNIDAVDRLIHLIFPHVQQQHPDTKLLIVGNQPPPHIQRMASDHICVTGWVPDVAPYLDRAAVVVVPVRLGGGMRVKVLEALAAGKAIVASARAVEGLNLENGKQYILAESDQEFADAVIRLLSDEQLRAELGARAHAWACANLGWERSISSYEALYTALLQQTETNGTMPPQISTIAGKRSNQSFDTK